MVAGFEKVHVAASPWRFRPNLNEMQIGRLFDQRHRVPRPVMLPAREWVTLLSEVCGVRRERTTHTQDGYRFIIDREWAMLSGTMRMMLSTDDGGTYAPFPALSQGLTRYRFFRSRKRSLPSPNSVRHITVECSFVNSRQRTGAGESC